MKEGVNEDKGDLAAKNANRRGTACRALQDNLRELRVLRGETHLLVDSALRNGEPDICACQI